MNKKLQDQLVAAFPAIYSDHDSRFAEDGVPVGNGWFGVLWRLSEKLAATGAKVYARQLKEKMGGLRVALHGENDERTFALVTAAEQESKRTCELCGGKGKRTTIGKRGAWIKTLCERCERKLAKERGKGPSGPWKEGRRLPPSIARGDVPRPDPRDLPPEGFVEVSYGYYPEEDRGAKKVAIIGSRDFPKLDLVRRFVADLPEGTVVVTGGARGVDRAAEGAAKKRGLEVTVMKPDWRRGKGAGLAGNAKIVEAVDEIAAFWDGRSRGTTHAIDLALKAGKPVRVFGKDGKVLSGKTWRAKRRH